MNPSRSKTPKAPKSSRGRILMIDDDADFVDSLSLRFERAGYEVLRGEDGRNAVESVELLRPDLVLLDVWMPFMTGLDVLDELHASRARSVPIVLLTGDAGIERHRREIEKKGVRAVYCKPFDTDLLIEEVGVLLPERV